MFLSSQAGGAPAPGANGLITSHNTWITLIYSFKDLTVMKWVEIDSVLIRCGNGASHEDRGWELVTSGTQDGCCSTHRFPTFWHASAIIYMTSPNQTVIRVWEKSCVTLLLAGNLCSRNTIMSNTDITEKSERGKVILLVLRNNETFF